MIRDVTRRRGAEPVRAELAVRLNGVTRLFDGLAAISQVNLNVAAGETVWLRGANGSGKSTLLRVVATAISPTFGGGAILGYDLIDGRAGIRARTELLGHRTRLYDDLTASENLRFACDLYAVAGSRRERAEVIANVLDHVGLYEVAGIRVGHFSQGMRQRLALARCMIRAPDLVLLDEPYAGLDPEARSVVDDLVEAARCSGGTVVLASHEAPPPHLIDRTVTIECGRLLTAVRAS